MIDYQDLENTTMHFNIKLLFTPNFWKCLCPMTLKIERCLRLTVFYVMCANKHSPQVQIYPVLRKGGLYVPFGSQSSIDVMDN